MTPTHTKKPVEIRAFVFNGHNPFDEEHDKAKLIPCDSTFDECINCKHPIQEHAYIKTNSGEALVCPGDYVINNPQFPDDYYPCKPDIFKATYDAIKDKKKQNDSSIDITDKDINLLAARLHAAELLITHSSNPIDIKLSIDFARQIICGARLSEPEVEYISFCEAMELINEDNETIISRKSYDIDYVYYNQEKSAFMAYKDGKEKFHIFDTKDYAANDWYIVN